MHDLIQATGYRVGRLIGCHQRSDRSYFIRGRQLPLCARCLGMVTGLAFAPMSNISITVAAILLLPMLLDGSTQLLGLRQSSNSLRLATGSAFGLGVGALFLRG